MARIQGPKGGWVVPACILFLLGLGTIPLMQSAVSEPHACPASSPAAETADEEAILEFSRNPIQYHLIPRMQTTSKPPPSLR
jgi:hypothetical protein